MKENNPTTFWLWEGPCIVCGKWRGKLKGLFCSNFLHARGIFPPCRSVFCPSCYKADPNVVFHIHKAEDDEGVVWRRKKDETRFLVARMGDHIFTPFQCDLCWFRNLKQRSPNSVSVADTRFLAYIRRASLDALWSRSPDTVSSSLSGIRKIIRLSDSLDFQPSLKPIGPWTVRDDWGFGLAIIILKASQEPGRTNKEYTQFDSIRKIASSFSNHFEASTQAASDTWVLRGDYSNTFFTSCPTRSEFFTRFKAGLKARMSRDVRGDSPIDYRILHKILFHLKSELLDSSTTCERRRWIATCGAYFVISFCLALRGNETLMLDLSGLKNYWIQGENETPPHVILPLLGKFKGEDSQRYHILLAPVVSNSGFEVKQWCNWLIAARNAEGFLNGPAFCDIEGFVLQQSVFNDELFFQLEWAKDAFPNLFSPDLDLSTIRTSRSFRKGSTSRAQDLLLDTSVVDTNNRWRSFENSKGAKPQHASLRDYYSSARLMSRKLLIYPQAM